ncbi:alpha/beta hydrolase [Clostridium chromiireducens]|uniref:alpha/beta hydrolase n=1 Tax=Clostridium chromiireducens TaxID=225345 RepID=UPI003AF62AC1
MALIQCNFYSRILKHNTTINVVLPIENTDLSNDENLDNIYKTSKKFKTIYLLHGAMDDNTGWLRSSNVERYATERGIALVLPAAENSYYTDMANGNKYYTYVTEEVPRFARSVFPLSDTREDNYIAGLSMGGYGAIKIALSNPERFSAVVSLSGVLDIESQVSSLNNKSVADYFAIFGDPNKVKESNNDLLYLLKKIKDSDNLIPRIYQACGTEDFLYEENIKFRDLARKLEIDITYEEGSGGHEWDFWDAYIKKALNWLTIL